jgi:hypothetical protein
MAFRKSIILWSKDAKVTENYIVADNTKVLLPGANPPTVTAGEVPQESTETSYDYLALDCVISESHAFSNEVTAYPISSGFLISEHTIKKNKMFSLTGMITNVNMFDGGFLSITNVGKVAGAMVSRVIGPVLGSLLGSAAHAMDSSGITKDPIKDKFEKLQELVTNGTIVHVATILGTYEGCVLREVRINQDSTTSSVLPVSLTFEQLRVIQPDGRIGFNVPDDQKQAMQQNTPTDTETMVKVLKQSGVGIIGGYIL